MRKVVAATAAFVAFAAMTAAEATAQTPPIWNWTGFYIGGNLGYSWGRSDSTLSLSDAKTGAVLDSATSAVALDGVIGGGQIGYNWQNGRWVFGLEADLQASSERSNTSFLCPGGTGLPPLPAGFAGVCSSGQPGETITALPVTDSLSERLDWFGTVRGRIGHMISPTVLPYLTGGLAFGEVHTADTISGTNFNIMGTPSAASSLISTNTVKVGWTIGGGFESVLSAHWTGKIEYLFIDLGSVSGSVVTPIIAPTGDFLAASYSSHITDNILRVGINYKFH
jgi:outer membrane immunogenic protein